MGNSTFKTKGGLFNKAQITNEIREAKRHGPGKVKTFIQNTLGIIIQRTFRIIIIIQNLELSFRIKLELLLRTHQFLHFHTLWVQVSNQKFGPNRIVLVLFPGYWLVKRRLSCQEDVNLFFDSPMFSQFGRYVCPLLWAKGSPKSMQREKAMPAQSLSSSSSLQILLLFLSSSNKYQTTLQRSFRGRMQCLHIIIITIVIIVITSCCIVIIIIA